MKFIKYICSQETPVFNLFTHLSSLTACRILYCFTVENKNIVQQLHYILVLKIRNTNKTINMYLTKSLRLGFFPMKIENFSININFTSVYTLLQSTTLPFKVKHSRNPFTYPFNPSTAKLLKAFIRFFFFN